MIITGTPDYTKITRYATANVIRLEDDMGEFDEVIDIIADNLTEGEARIIAAQCPYSGPAELGEERTAAVRIIANDLTESVEVLAPEAA